MKFKSKRNENLQPRFAITMYAEYTNAIKRRLLFGKKK